VDAQLAEEGERFVVTLARRELVVGSERWSWRPNREDGFTMDFDWRWQPLNEVGASGSRWARQAAFARSCPAARYTNARPTAGAWMKYGCRTTRGTTCGV